MDELAGSPHSLCSSAHPTDWAPDSVAWQAQERQVTMESFASETSDETNAEARAMDSAAPELFGCGLSKRWMSETRWNS